MRAIVDAVNGSPFLSQLGRYESIHLVNKAFRMNAAGHSGLIRDDNHPETGFFQATNARRCSRQKPHLAQMGDIADLFVDGPIPIQKNCVLQDSLLLRSFPSPL